MYTIRRLILLVLLGMALIGCNPVSLGLGQLQGSGHVTSETRPVDAFTKIDVAGVGEVIITQGDTNSLMVETDDNLQTIMLGDVRDNTLYMGIKAKQSFSNATHVTFTVTVKDLTTLNFSGAGMVNIRDLSGEQLIVNHSGAGSLRAAGTVVEQHVTLSGAGNYDGTELISERATVDLSGFGNVVINASQRLDATVSGVGSITYLGSPELHEQVSGVGTIRQHSP